MFMRTLAGAGWCIYPTTTTPTASSTLSRTSRLALHSRVRAREAVDGPYYWLLHRLALYKPVTWEPALTSAHAHVERELSTSSTARLSWTARLPT